MGNSIGPPQLIGDAQVTHKQSGAMLTIKHSGQIMIHSIAEQGYTAEYPIRYQIGAGRMGRTYAIQLGDSLFESPASWFKAYGWDVSPGYGSVSMIDFDRPINASCLFCHSGNAAFAGGDRRQLAVPQLAAIGCDRCHGSGEQHMRHPSASNIVNPARLAAAERDSVCEQCHLEGETRVLNPGKSWADFRAGQRAEETFTTYVLKGDDNRKPIAVSHAEQLAQSQCARGSGGRLWCGTCHDAHGESKDRPREIAQICRSCHATLSAASHPPVEAECVSCHMPPTSTIDVAHAAVTDHRILRRPGATDVPSAVAQAVIAWREPSPSIRERNQGLAELTAAVALRSDALRIGGIARLQSLPRAQQQNDSAVLSSLQGVYLHERKLSLAQAAGEQASALSPTSAVKTMNLGMVLEAEDKLADAEAQFRRAIGLDPLLKQAYAELVKLEVRQNHTDQAQDTIERFLKWSPQDIQFRIWKDQARKHD